MADRKDSKRQRSEDKTGRLEAEDRSRVRWFYLIALTALVVSIIMALIWARSDFIDRFEMVAVRDERIDDSMRNEVISIVTKQKLFLGAVGFLLATTVVGFVPWLGGRLMGSRVIRDILFPRKVDRSLHDRYIRAKDRPTGKWLMVVVASITLSECGIIIWIHLSRERYDRSSPLAEQASQSTAQSLQLCGACRDRLTGRGRLMLPHCLCLAGERQLVSRDQRYKKSFSNASPSWRGGPNLPANCVIGSHRDCHSAPIDLSHISQISRVGAS